MIKNMEVGDILKTEASHIAFAINKEGIADSSLAREVVKRGWPELEDGVYNIGTTLSKKIDEKTYHAMVCYSLRLTTEGIEQSDVISSCLEQINTDDVIAVEIGTELAQKEHGTDINKIQSSMENSNKVLVLYQQR